MSIKIQLTALRQSSSLSFKRGLVNLPHWSLGNLAVAALVLQLYESAQMQIKISNEEKKNSSPLGADKQQPVVTPAHDKYHSETYAAKVQK